MCKSETILKGHANDFTFKVQFMMCYTQSA